MGTLGKTGALIFLGICISVMGTRAFAQDDTDTKPKRFSFSFKVGGGVPPPNASPLEKQRYQDRQFLSPEAQGYKSIHDLQVIWQGFTHSAQVPHPFTPAAEPGTGKDPKTREKLAKPQLDVPIVNPVAEGNAPTPEAQPVVKKDPSDQPTDQSTDVTENKTTSMAN
jgi:hypothetical protein